jgi:dolichol-phosphate mannosyltransferase
MSGAARRFEPRLLDVGSKGPGTLPADGTIDVIVPTFKEAANIPLLIERLAALRSSYSRSLRLTIVDDDSRDGSLEAVEALALPWVQLIVRTGARGLSAAVLEGIERTTGEFIVVMDADLSHPPEAIPRMLEELRNGSDFVVGSRYVEGGVTHDDWGLLRWLNSRFATYLARPLTSIKDPMSGFFALERETFALADPLNPIGYKIGLELLVKCRCSRIAEVPIAFADRIHGQSKLSLREQLRYLRHIRRLFMYRYRTSSEVMQFIVVGASGVLVNLGVVTGLLRAGATAPAGIAGGIVASICTNFFLNRRFTFAHSRSGHMPTQFLAYLVSVSFGSLVNYTIALSLLAHIPGLLPQFASLGGIAAATVVNFIALKYIVFKRKHYRPR